MNSGDEGLLALNGGQPVRKEMLPLLVPYFDDQDYGIVVDTLKSTFVSGDGPQCREFEKALADYLGAKYVFFTTSCTAALDLAYMVKGFEAEGEVLVPDFTFTSTALAPILNNLRVVLVDVESETGNINVSKIEAKITPRTVAISPVDYAGRPADMDGVNHIARQYGLYVVQDAAQSIGAKFKGQKVGTLADVTCFSFHGTKNLVVGEGGALVTESDEIAERVVVMREKGTDKHSFLLDKGKLGYYAYTSVGNSYVQSNILGALGITQLKKLDWMNRRRKEIAEYYLEELQGYPAIRLPPTTEQVETNWHLFYVLVPEQDKGWFASALKAEGVMANVHYTPLHRNPFYESVCEFDESEFPGSMSFFNSLVRVPLFPSMTDADAADVVCAIKKILECRYGASSVASPVA